MMDGGNGRQAVLGRTGETERLVGEQAARIDSARSGLSYIGIGTPCCTFGYRVVQHVAGVVDHPHLAGAGIIVQHRHLIRVAAVGIEAVEPDVRL